MRRKIITDVEYLHRKQGAIEYHKSLETLKVMKIFMLINKNLADKTLGLASNQLGLEGRVILYRADTKHNFKHLINTTLETYKNTDTMQTIEQCLSVPNVSILVKRYKSIVVQSYTTPLNWEYSHPTLSEGLVIQHEIDHLDGILMTDKEVK